MLPARPKMVFWGAHTSLPPPAALPGHPPGTCCSGTPWSSLQHPVHGWEEGALCLRRPPTGSVRLYWQHPTVFTGGRLQRHPTAGPGVPRGPGVPAHRGAEHAMGAPGAHPGRGTPGCWGVAGRGEPPQGAGSKGAFRNQTGEWGAGGSPGHGPGYQHPQRASTEPKCHQGPKGGHPKTWQRVPAPLKSSLSPKGHPRP